MVTFRNSNNGRRNNFRRNDRNFKSNSDRSKYNSNFTTNENFQRRFPGKNNHNAPKLIEKYNNLAREALSGGDKILSENYFQHADHFTRILNEKENYRKNKLSNTSGQQDTTLDTNNDEKLNLDLNNKDQGDDLKIESETN
tara:strand:- start:1522 stop:1944 length:423 start_codon:yes stop_codon:yes gene_type:complete